MMNRRFFALSLCACLLLAGCGAPGAAAGSAPESAPPQQEETLSTPYAVDFRLTSGHHTAGIDFPAGVYDLEVTDGSGNLDISIKDKSGTEVTTIYMYLGEYSSYGKDYKNLVLPEGSTIKSEGDIQIKFTPSEKIVSDDYADYYEKY